MTDLRFYGEPPAGIGDDELPGRLIVIEGTDGVGRSTIISLLKEWLETSGYAVVDSGLTRSPLVGPGIERAKRGHVLDPVTLNLFYATDFWDRFERIILPALRAGMVALVDRYIFSLIARGNVRGTDPEWLQLLYSFALIPDATIYLDIDVEYLLPRITERGFDYWESGGDYLQGVSVYDSFVQHQRAMLEEFRTMAPRYDFQIVDARRPTEQVYLDTRACVERALLGMTPPLSGGASVC